MTVSTNENNAITTLECVKRITEELGCKTSLGISNVSFGLPSRDILNSTFFMLALQNGLSAAIINPESKSVMDAYYGYCALSHQDTGFENYINYCSSSETTMRSFDTLVDKSSLNDAIIFGRKEKAASLTEALLCSDEPLTIIDRYIIPALDKTGSAFETGKIFLPQLLMGAEAAASAVEQIRLKMSTQKGSKCKVILASVKGDIHDIGKNIVKLLLENYSYEVIDLGKDVSPENIVSAVKHHNADILGLSALMSTTLESMRETVAIVKEAFPQSYIFVGGAVVTEEFAEIIGADKYTRDAMESIRFAESIYNQKKDTRMSAFFDLF